MEVGGGPVASHCAAKAGSEMTINRGWGGWFLVIRARQHTDTVIVHTVMGTRRVGIARRILLRSFGCRLQ
jgi:hypothetical protein